MTKVYGKCPTFFIIIASRGKNLLHKSDQFCIFLNLCANLIVKSESAYHAIHRTICLRFIIGTKFFCCSLHQSVFVYVVFIRVSQPKICAYGVCVLIMVFPGAVIILITYFLTRNLKSINPDCQILFFII